MDRHSKRRCLDLSSLEKGIREDEDARLPVNRVGEGDANLTPMEGEDDMRWEWDFSVVAQRRSGGSKSDSGSSTGVYEEFMASSQRRVQAIQAQDDNGRGSALGHGHGEDEDTWLGDIRLMVMLRRKRHSLDIAGRCIIAEEVPTLNALFGVLERELNSHLRLSGLSMQALHKVEGHLPVAQCLRVKGAEFLIWDRADEGLDWQPPGRWRKVLRDAWEARRDWREINGYEGDDESEQHGEIASGGSRKGRRRHGKETCVKKAEAEVLLLFS